MIDVFFRGRGYWYAPDKDGGTTALTTYRASGVFCLFEDDEIRYRHTKSLDGVIYLRPNLTHPDCELTKLMRRERVVSDLMDKYYFQIGLGIWTPTAQFAEHGSEAERFWIEYYRPTLVIAEPYNAVKGTGINSNNDRRSLQIKLLLSVIDKLKYERLNIPVGGKQKALVECLKSTSVFTSESVFNRVWSELSVDGRISIAEKENFLSIQ